MRTHLETVSNRNLRLPKKDRLSLRHLAGKLGLRSVPSPGHAYAAWGKGCVKNANRLVLFGTPETVCRFLARTCPLHSFFTSSRPPSCPSHSFHLFHHFSPSSRSPPPMS